MQFKLGPLIALLLISSCDIYKSSDRKKFEEDHFSSSAQAQSLIPLTEVQNLIFQGCADESLSAQATESIQLSTHPDQYSHLWLLKKHLINNKWIYEADNMNGDYCFYEKEF